jgi:lysophospholipase L1-like esterase
MSSQSRKSFVFRILLFAVATFLAVAAVELFLDRLAKRAVEPRPGQAPLQWDDCELVVRCFGDSYTFGMGVDDPTYSYPAQLQTILSEKYPDRKICVQSIAKPGLNTSEVLALINQPPKVTVTAPSIFLIVAGQNNNWNLHASSALLEGYASLPNKRWIEKLQRSKTGKLAVIAYERGESLVERIAQVGDFPDAADDEGAIVDRNDPVEAAFLTQWIETDIRRMAETATKRDAKAMFGTYHQSWAEPIVRATVESLSLPYCPVPKRGEDWEAMGLLSDDGFHPNEKGYAAFAAHMARCLKKSGLIEKALEGSAR